MNDERISVIDAASELGLRKSALFKILGRLGIETRIERSDKPDHKGQAIAHISLHDFEPLSQELASKNAASSTSESETIDAEYVPVEAGVFYLIQLEPQHDPGRFKVGFVVSISERLRSHRCSAPFATLVRTWPCRRVWERTAIECVTSRCERLHTEVFRTDDLDAVAARCDQFFSIMPEVMRNVQTVEGADAEPAHAPEPSTGAATSGQPSPPAE
ncbi:MAG: hypothetical protein NTW96_15435 [Planctomycetia bacterium]|nr:hypothetical protein [Planctomycetia bacterium]